MGTSSAVFTISPLCTVPCPPCWQCRGELSGKPSAPSGQRTASTIHQSLMQLQHWGCYFPWSSISLQDHGQQLSQPLARVSAHRHHPSTASCTLSLLLFCFRAPAYTWAVNEAGSHFVVFFFVCEVECRGSWKGMQLWRELRETASVSLSASLQPSFMPLSLAQRLTLSTPLSLLTPLLTEPRCWPQQYINMPLRRLIISTVCANVVHTRGEGMHGH